MTSKWNLGTNHIIKFSIYLLEVPNNWAAKWIQLDAISDKYNWVAKVYIVGELSILHQRHWNLYVKSHICCYRSLNKSSNQWCLLLRDYRTVHQISEEVSYKPPCLVWLFLGSHVDCFVNTCSVRLNYGPENCEYLRSGTMIFWRNNGTFSHKLEIRWHFCYFVLTINNSISIIYTDDLAVSSTRHTNKTLKNMCKEYFKQNKILLYIFDVLIYVKQFNLTGIKSSSCCCYYYYYLHIWKQHNHVIQT